MRLVREALVLDAGEVVEQVDGDVGVQLMLMLRIEGVQAEAIGSIGLFHVLQEEAAALVRPRLVRLDLLLADEVRAAEVYESVRARAVIATYDDVEVFLVTDTFDQVDKFGTSALKLAIELEEVRSLVRLQILLFRRLDVVAVHLAVAYVRQVLTALHYLIAAGHRCYCLICALRLDVSHDAVVVDLIVR